MKSSTMKSLYVLLALAGMGWNRLAELILFRYNPVFRLWWKYVRRSSFGGQE